MNSRYMHITLINLYYKYRNYVYNVYDALVFNNICLCFISVHLYIPELVLSLLFFS